MVDDMMVNLTDGDLTTAFDVGKYTIAGEKGSQNAFNFLNRYMKMEPRMDTPWGNIVSCEGVLDSFIARNDLRTSASGKCTLITSPTNSPKGELTTKDTEATDGVVAVVLGDKRVDPCHFMGNTSFAVGQASYYSYEVQATSEKQCCLACQGDSDCLGANYVPVIVYPPPHVGFGVHLPTSNARETVEGFNVSVVEKMVTEKVGNMTRFDAWMDNSLGIWTRDLDSYIHVFDSEHVPYLAAEWTTGETHVISVFVHAEGSQLILELMANSSTKLEHREDLTSLEPRLPESFILHLIEQQDVEESDVKQARISRAATDLNAVDDFYVQGMGILRTLDYEGDDVSVRCYEWSVGTAQVCYTKRPDSKTKGWFTVKIFEEVLKDSALHFGRNPLCLMNRWFDNHYSVTADHFSDQWKLNYIIDYVDREPNLPIACHPTEGLYYIVDPSGWAVQMPNGVGTRIPKRCGGGERSGEQFFGTLNFVFCDVGTCSLS